MPAMATLTATAPSLCVSVVVYHSDLARLEETLAALLVAVQKAREAAALTTVAVLIVDNSVCRVYHQALRDTIGQLPWERTEVVCRVLQAAANLGYGAGHNMALEQGASDCHLVLNPDIVTDARALAVGLRYLREHPQVVLVCPRGELADGSPAYLSKRMPSVLVLALRAFAPPWLQARFAARLAAYAMHDVHAAGRPTAVPLASGCFMLVRGAVLRRMGGFDPAFFLYFEDYDLSLRLAALGELHYLPEMCVRHYGGETARKGLQHVAYFLRAGLRFFHRYGWRWL
ncbi:glycosyltransferase [Haliea salexigens]|uniref:glycosyltransferase n=1 Tax=Haliea salexigens TaxID=287487 RepID=UPI000A014906|nr:glycosyltransferase family 2 protein [Haliea salexigens]